ncbi:RHS repeat-associated core domain-containing protein [Pseudoalteromonas rubra]|uniref:RHS repeat-associated core domain-containing protein n=1 Tax=Pseudoalteromonas rubra TaxID=43658 RepID=UPI000F785714|nr:RHS repeat-associated core domain-containing protein [Pseudoalteromonas rubra]
MRTKLSYGLIFFLVLGANVFSVNANEDLTNLYTARFNQVTSAHSSNNLSNALIVTPQGKDMFTDKIDLSTGTVSFVNNDISLPGNFDLPVEVIRRYDTNYPFKRGWYFDLPRISYTYMSGYQKTTLPLSWQDGKYCSGGVSRNSTDIKYQPVFAMSGSFDISIPGRTQSMLLLNKGAWSKAGKGFPYYTNTNWLVSCYKENGKEGFVAHAPNGDKYYFSDYSTTSSYAEWATAIQVFSSGNDEPYYLQRADIKVTKVIDKYGNWVKYSYNPLRITASDGRVLELKSNTGSHGRSNVRYSETISGYNKNKPSDKREWVSIHYNRSSVKSDLKSEFTLPSGRSWLYTLNYIDSEPLDLMLAAGSGDVRTGCGNLNTLKHTFTVRHPNKSVAKFHVNERGDSSINLPIPVLGRTTDCISRLSINKKEVFPRNSNSALYTWVYSYSNAHSDYARFDSKSDPNGAPSNRFFSGSSPKNINKFYHKWTTVNGPEDYYLKYYINRDNRSPFQNKVFAIESRKKAGGGLLSTKKFNYWHSDELGLGYATRSANRSLSMHQVHLSEDALQVGDDSYKRTFYDFDSFGSPLREKWSLNDDHRYFKNSYTSDTSKWIIKMPGGRSVSSNNRNFKELFSVDYQIISASDGSYSGLILPYHENRLGVRQVTYNSYWNDGNIRKLTKNVKSYSGKTLTEEYSDYYSGVAKKVTLNDRYSSKKLEEKYEVDLMGNITAFTNLNGHTTNYYYDGENRTSAIVFPSDSNIGTLRSLAIDWDDTKNRRTITLCRIHAGSNQCDGNGYGYKVTEQYDAFDRKSWSAVYDPAIPNTKARNTYQSFKYDSNNRLLKASYPSFSLEQTQHNGEQFRYDHLGRVVYSKTNVEGEKTFYYGSGNRVVENKGLDNEVTRTYRHEGKPSYNLLEKVVSKHSTTTINVDVIGLTHSVKQSHGAHSFTETRLYDSNNKLCLIKRADVGNELLKFDALGRKVWSKKGVSSTRCVGTTPPDVTYFLYDNLGNLKEKNLPGTGIDVKYELDNVGNLVSVSRGGVVQRYNYNSLNLLEDEQLYIKDEAPLLVDYVYDLNANLKSLVYPDGSVVNYYPSGTGKTSKIDVFNGLGELEQSVLGGVEYHASGAPSKFTYANGVAYQMVEEKDKTLPRSLKYFHKGSVVSGFEYTYDERNNFKSISDLTDRRYSLSDMSYDGLNRLSSIRGGSQFGSINIDYDYLGNIERYSSKKRNLSYNYQRATNRLIQVSGISGKYGAFQYDSRGNVTNNGSYKLYYDASGSVTQANGLRFTYDSHGRRVQIVDEETKRSSMYNLHGKLLYTESGDIQGEGVNYIYFGKMLVAKYGSVAVPKGNFEKKRYLPFGETLNEQDDDVGYTGHWYDKELGLNYMQARYYDPVIGRFYSNDPVGFTGEVDTFNRYSYVANNPYKYTDPNGEEKYSIALTGEVMFIAGVRAGFSVGFDTETLEISGSANAGPRLGLGLAVKPSYSVEKSGTKAVNTTTTEIVVNADAGLGPLAIGKDIVSEKTINGEHQAQASFTKPEAKAGLAASVGVDFKIEQKSTVIRDAVDNIIEFFK